MAEAQVPEVDRTLLTQEQRAIYEEWERFFQSAGWRLYVEKFGPRLTYLMQQYRSVRGAQNLGFIQGSIAQLSDLLVIPDRLVAADFIDSTDDAAEPEPPTGPQDWQA